MHKTLEQGQAFVKDFLPDVSFSEKVKIAIAPPFTLLHSIKSLLANSKVVLAGQDCHWEEKGAYTGEISPSMLVDAGCEFVILGHSERRKYFGETPRLIGKKIIASLKAGLSPILCIGENLDEREEGRTEKILEEQMKGSLELLTDPPSGFVIAYEPVWAIGTGQVATPAQIKEAHAFIHQWLLKHWKNQIKCLVLYGGSVTSENVSEFMGDPSVQGALVGGASLKSKGFSHLIQKSIAKRWPK